MGRERGRGDPLIPDLAGTLARVAEAMSDARDPWWVIGSAAAALHGAATKVGDVDVLLSIADAWAIAARMGIVAAPGGQHPLFRSTLFFVWDEPPLAVEFMAGFAVAGEPIKLRTWDRLDLGGRPVFVPARDELRAMLERFGRPKDVARLAALR